MISSSDIKKYDKSNMLALIESFPKQCAEARNIGEGFKLPKGFKARFKNVLVTGLGGSAIGADLARSYVSGEAKVPIFVNRNYTLPNFVDEETLVIASSYSGNTEETLSAYRDARSRKATLMAITSGGELKKMAEQDKAPCVIIPTGFPPRCALGYSFFPLLVMLSKLGIVADKTRA
ncbi:MAG: SIS domain-containing protein, partial [Candidatus Omnitrophica bacterium]|nr:SIS domain-containing protein [Candidatus Omnitrophota bacterium]